MCICSEYIMYVIYDIYIYIPTLDPTILVLKIRLERKSEMGQEFSSTMCGLVRETNHLSHDAAKW